jgi:hypothetical protein
MARFSAWESFCLVCRVCILDVLFPLARKGVEITTIVYFWYTDHYYWGALTTAALLIPGVLEVFGMFDRTRFLKQNLVPVLAKFVCVKCKKILINPDGPT